MKKQNLQKVISRWKKQKTRIVAIAGQRKAGKDVLVRYILKHYPQFLHVRITEPTILIAKILELPPERRIMDTLAGLNKIFHPILGENVMKRRAARIIDRVKPKYAIVEALRPLEEYEEFVIKRKGILIGVTSSPEIRYKRAVADLKKSKEKKDEGTLSFKKFLEIDKQPMQKQIKWIVKRAHFVINNDYSAKDYHARIEEIMEKLGVAKRN